MGSPTGSPPAGGDVVSLSKKEKDVLIGGGFVGVERDGGGARLKRASSGCTSFDSVTFEVVGAEVGAAGREDLGVGFACAGDGVGDAEG